MGVINATPDSFFADSRVFEDGALSYTQIDDVAGRMIEDGACMIDVGGESTRPGAAAVGEAAEIRRVIPMVERLSRLDVVVSIDTSKPRVAELALEAGAHLVNDVRAARTPGMLEVVARAEAAICLMHMQGLPATMQSEPSYDDVVAEVAGFLMVRLAACRAAGIDDSRILLDPGFGFGKSLEHNLTLLRRLQLLAIDGLPVLVGISRKGMLGALTGRDVAGRLAAGLAAATLAVVNGASVVRTHDVKETVDALKVVNEVIDD